MKTIDNTTDPTVISLLPLIKDKSFLEINDIVLKWAKTRVDKNEQSQALKWASLAGILEANITILLDHINQLEKNKL
jgi:hypothetical protein